MVCVQQSDVSREYYSLGNMRTHHHNLMTLSSVNLPIRLIPLQAISSTTKVPRILTNSQIASLLPHIPMITSNGETSENRIPIVFLEYTRNHPFIILKSVNMSASENCSYKSRFFLEYYMSKGASVIFIITLANEGEHIEAYKMFAR